MEKTFVEVTVFAIESPNSQHRAIFVCANNIEQNPHFIFKFKCAKINCSFHQKLSSITHASTRTCFCVSVNFNLCSIHALYFHFIIHGQDFSIVLYKLLNSSRNERVNIFSISGATSGLGVSRRVNSLGVKLLEEI